jgi:hypothetical protein
MYATTAPYEPPLLPKNQEFYADFKNANLP